MVQCNKESSYGGIWIALCTIPILPLLSLVLDNESQQSLKGKDQSLMEIQSAVEESEDLANHTSIVRKCFLARSEDHSDFHHREESSRKNDEDELHMSAQQQGGDLATEEDLSEAGWSVGDWRFHGNAGETIDDGLGGNDKPRSRASPPDAD